MQHQQQIQNPAPHLKNGQLSRRSQIGIDLLVIELAHKAKKYFSTFAGTNAYWLPFLTNDADIDKAFAAIKAANLKVVRTWAFNDATSCSGVYFQCWSSNNPVINTGSTGLGRLDAVVKAAEKYGVKLVLPLGIYHLIWVVVGIIVDLFASF